MFVLLFAGALVLFTIVIVWLSVELKSVGGSTEVTFSWDKGLKFKKK